MEGWSREGGMNGWIRCRFLLPYRKKKRKEPLPTRCLPDLSNREEEGSKEQMIGWMEGQKGAVADHPASLVSRASRAYRAVKEKEKDKKKDKEKDKEKDGWRDESKEKRSLPASSQ